MSIFDPTYKNIEIDTKLKELVLNRLTKDEFDKLSAHSPDEVWFIQDEDLSGQPIVVDTTPRATKLSELQNDVGYLSAVSWSQVSGKPTIPTNTSQLTNDSGFITSAYVQNNALSVWRQWYLEEMPEGLKFTANTAGSTVSMTATGNAPSLDLLYSTDGSNWNTFTVGSTTITLANVGDYVLFKAGPNGNSRISASGQAHNSFVLTGSIAASGSVMYLLDENGGDTITETACFCHLLWKNAALTTAPELPATTLAENCYEGMFEQCTSLTEAPYLPATELPNQCYYWMFAKCSSLTSMKIAYSGNFNTGSTSPTNYWVYNIGSASGTFYYNGSDTTRGNYAIPSGWTVTPF